jgi:hypothetical protein
VLSVALERYVKKSKIEYAMLIRHCGIQDFLPRSRIQASYKTFPPFLKFQ